MTKGKNIIRCLATALLATAWGAHALPTADSPDGASGHVARASFRDDFTEFNKDVWSCEYTCPTIVTEKARFHLSSGVEPRNEGSWSKARYKPARFTSGRFSVRFSLTARPAQKVWWGVALWDDGPAADKSQFNEINFGYTVDGSLSDSQLLFESTRRGQGQSVPVDTGVDLYTEEYHNATLEYDSARVAFYFDGKLLHEITDSASIPTDAMDLVLGPRLVDGSEPLTDFFLESIDWVQIN
ncbi:putative glycoside hydrolase family protein [Rosellinia necatrix]|uniref:Putative glycoside hydrolase family protein n=1 Tax=Rosellinia necatrix TaxID=77044 RepID=A0A1W2TND8_ROSNE|nr:putative glycoside hydrolase family protein [Rosellinia necatrix]